MVLEVRGSVSLRLKAGCLLSCDLLGGSGLF